MNAEKPADIPIELLLWRAVLLNRLDEDVAESRHLMLMGDRWLSRRLPLPTILDARFW
jgi:hypothetical protein